MKTPWHIWVVGVVVILWNGFAAMGAHWPMQIVIGGACVFFLRNASTMARRGVLR